MFATVWAGNMYHGLARVSDEVVKDAGMWNVFRICALVVGVARDMSASWGQLNSCLEAKGLGGPEAQKAQKAWMRFFLDFSF